MTFAKSTSGSGPASAETSPKTMNSNIIVHFMRHAQPAHKTGPVDDLTMPDPDISSKGRSQCLAFSLALESHIPYITHIFSSPMRRTLNTSCLALWPLLERGLTVHALPELQNLDMGPSGIGMGLPELHQEYTGNFGLFGGKERKSVVDTKTFMAEDWNFKESGRWSTDEKDWRVNYMRGFLKALIMGKEKIEVVVVTHGSFLRVLVDDVQFPDVVITSCVFGDDGNFKKISEDELQTFRKKTEE